MGFITINNGTNITLTDNLFFSSVSTGILVNYFNTSVIGAFNFEGNNIILISSSSNTTNNGLQINAFNSSEIVFKINKNYIANS